MGYVDLIEILPVEWFGFNKQEYLSRIKKDYIFNASFRGCKKLPDVFLYGREWSYIKCLRKFQSNQNNMWGRFYKIYLKCLAYRYGIDVEGNSSFGDGLIIGHWGRIVINGDVKFGKELFITHGVTIGRDVRGKKKGVPSFGDRVCIRANSTVVGKVRIGDDVLIAPNTFVNFDVPSHSIVIGNPAKIISRENATEGHIGSLK